MDGRNHGLRAVLMVMIDDATNRTLARLIDRCAMLRSAALAQILHFVDELAGQPSRIKSASSSVSSATTSVPRRGDGQARLGRALHQDIAHGEIQRLPARRHGKGAAHSAGLHLLAAQRADGIGACFMAGPRREPSFLKSAFAFSSARSLSWC
jgi:hypothetical protein